jgi:hypothetical protein
MPTAAAVAIEHGVDLLRAFNAAAAAVRVALP